MRVEKDSECVWAGFRFFHLHSSRHLWGRDVVSKKAIKESEETYNVDGSECDRLFLCTASEAEIMHHTHLLCVCVWCIGSGSCALSCTCPQAASADSPVLIIFSHICSASVCWAELHVPPKKKPPTGIPNKGIKCVQLLSLCTTFGCGSFSGCSSAGIQCTHVRKESQLKSGPLIPTVFIKTSLKLISFSKKKVIQFPNPLVWNRFPHRRRVLV